MNDKMLQQYLETSVYTDVGSYRDFVLSLPGDIASIGMLVCGQITHPPCISQKFLPIWKRITMGKFRPTRSAVLKMRTNCILRLSP